MVGSGLGLGGLVGLAGRWGCKLGLMGLVGWWPARFGWRVAGCVGPRGGWGSCLARWW